MLKGDDWARDWWTLRSELWQRTARMVDGQLTGGQIIISTAETVAEARAVWEREGLAGLRRWREGR